MTKGKQKSKTGEPRPPLVSMRWLYIILFLLIGLFWWSSRETTKETNWSEFNEKMLQQRDVLKVDIANNEEVWVYIKPGSLGKEQYKDVAKGMFGFANPGAHGICRKNTRY